MRHIFNGIARNPYGIYDLDRSQVVAALEWNDPNGDYRVTDEEEPEYMTTTDLQLALLVQVAANVMTVQS